MLRSILTFGTIAGLLVGIPLFAITVSQHGHPPLAWGAVIGYTTMLVALSAVFVAIKRRRDVDLGGVIRFWPAFGLGLGVSFVAGLFYVLAWEAATVATHMDFASGYAKAVLGEARARGESAEALSKLGTQMEAFKAQYANPLYRVPMTFAEIFPVGVLVSLISAALLRNSRFLPLRAR